MDLKGLKWLENYWIWLEMAGSCFKLLEIPGNDWICQEMAWLEMATNGLDIAVWVKARSSLFLRDGVRAQDRTTS